MVWKALLCMGKCVGGTEQGAVWMWLGNQIQVSGFSKIVESFCSEYWSWNSVSSFWSDFSFCNILQSGFYRDTEASSKTLYRNIWMISCNWMKLQFLSAFTVNTGLLLSTNDKNSVLAVCKCTLKLVLVTLQSLVLLTALLLYVVLI